MGMVHVPESRVARIFYLTSDIGALRQSSSFLLWCLLNGGLSSPSDSSTSTPARLRRVRRQTPTRPVVPARGVGLLTPHSRRCARFSPSTAAAGPVEVVGRCRKAVPAPHGVSITCSPGNFRKLLVGAKRGDLEYKNKIGSLQTLEKRPSGTSAEGKICFQSAKWRSYKNA